MQIKKATPIFSVEAIETVLPFWERLGFERQIEVPGDDGLVFVSLGRDGAEVMFQTVASVAEDLPALAEEAAGVCGMLYLEVEELDAVEPLLGDAEVVMPRRTTFYGAEEIFVRDPAGHVIGFAEFAAKEED